MTLKHKEIIIIIIIIITSKAKVQNVYHGK